MRILREMGVGPPGARRVGEFRPAAIGRALGVTHQTVKDRVRAMEAEGIIEGYLVVPNIHALGGAFAPWLYSIDEREKPRALAALERVPRVMGYLDFLGPSFYVTAVHEAHESREDVAEEIERAIGKRPERGLIRHVPEPARAYTLLDLRILGAMMQDARASHAALAERVGVTARTVKNRVDRMRRDKLCITVPHVDRANLPGFVFVHYMVDLAPGREREGTDAFLERFRDEVLFACTTTDRRHPFFDAGLCLRSASEVEARRQEAAALPGVASVVALVPRRGWDRFDYLHGLFRRRVDALAAAPA